MKMRLPRYPRQSGARLRGFGSFLHGLADVCQQMPDGTVDCGVTYVNTAAGQQQTDWRPVVDVVAGVVKALIGPQGQQYQYPSGQQPVYQPGATYSPPWYERVPTWGWAAGGALIVGLALASRR